MLRHKHSDIGVAVSIPGGLITPVVRHAEQKSLSVISNEMKDFAARARARKLAPEEYQGGSSAVSNLGMYGSRISTPSSILRMRPFFRWVPQKNARPPATARWRRRT